MIIDEGPVGIGDFEDSLPPGSGSGQPFTDAMVDVMLSPDCVPNAAYRVRLKGFDHRMPTQDVLDSIGGAQANSAVEGGLRVWGISNIVPAYRVIAIAGVGSTDSGVRAEAPLILQTLKHDLSDPVEGCVALAPNENVLAVLNGHDTILLLKGNGDLVMFGGITSPRDLMLSGAPRTTPGGMHVAIGGVIQDTGAIAGGAQDLPAKPYTYIQCDVGGCPGLIPVYRR
jgi:hypothetical protein